MDKTELRVEMVKKHESTETLANKIGMNVTTLYNKINGKTEFTLSELTKIQAVLDIDDDRFRQIFFSGNLS